MTKIWGRPLRPLTQAIWPLVLGFHTGATSEPLKDVSRLEAAPLASAEKISGSPRMEDEKASFVPSEDQAGVKLPPPKWGKLTIRPKSSEYIRICHEGLRWESTRPLKATRELSGETRGERAIDRICVSCCWPAPS